MSDRKPDDQAPLFPRRGLAGPAAAAGRGSSASDGQPAAPASSRQEPAGGQATDRKADGDTPARTDEKPGPGAARDAASDSSGPGAATQTMPRVSAPETGTRPPTGGPPAAQAPSSSPAGPAAAAAATRPKQTRKARLRMVRIDPWSVMKMAFALSIALAVVTVIAVAIVWSVLDAAGVWESINTSIASLDANASQSGFDVQEYVGLGRVMGLTMLVAAADVVLLTALATLGAFMYNLAAALLGGLEVTLAEDR